MVVALNEFGRMWAVVGPDVHGAIERVGSRGRYVLGSEVTQFEETLARRTGSAHAIGVANGMDAIEIGLRAMGLAEGDAVLTTPLSAFATTLAILRAGGRPLFSDVDTSGLLDLDLAERTLRRARDAGHPIRFLLPVHLYGRCMDLNALQRLRDKYELLILEDCAQSLGASWYGRHCGNVGRAAALSLYPTKNLGGLGDGGALFTSDAELATQARMLRNYGQTSQYHHDVVGLNSRLDELQAAVLLDAMLPRLDTWNARREEIASAYLAGLNPSLVVLPQRPPPHGHVWHLFPAVVSTGSRSACLRHLARKGVVAGVHYPKLIPDQVALGGDRSASSASSLTRARQFAAREVSLPIHPFMQAAEIEHVMEAMNTWSGE